MYKKRDKVQIVSDNENYDEYRNQVLTITEIATNTAEHQGYDNSMNGMQLVDLEDENGEDVPFSLYEYEITPA